MAIKEWWGADRKQRYWMEITDREDLGADLRAPKSGQGGREVFHYELVRYTNPGDIVFHWHKTRAGMPAIVGWSEVIGPLREENFAWVPQTERALKGREKAAPAWIMPLGSLHLLDTPITREALLALRQPILDLAEELKRTVQGFGYYPFNRYGPDSMRAYQGYLVKFPAELVPIIEQAGPLELPSTSTAGVFPRDRTDAPVVPSTGQGLLQEAELRIALEQHAVRVAKDYFRDRGATNIDVLGKPYDLRLDLDGVERHVEVKGSSQLIDKVLLTRNEVAHARNAEHVDLVVVDGIEYERTEAGYQTAGGNLRIWTGWAPSDDSLTAMTFTHALSPRKRRLS